jgi:glutamate/tyrosine decarboxylase-like PLP-dependent enzyme
MSREVILLAVYTATSATRHAASQMADKVVTCPVVVIATAIYSLRKFAESLRLKNRDL